jgi:PAS domain S-box-containing protein
MKMQLKEYTQNLEAKVREATLEVRRKSNFLAKLIRSSNDAIIATDQNKSVVIYNPSAQCIMGYSPEEVIGRRSISDILPTVPDPIMPQSVKDHSQSCEFPRTETVVRAKDGSSIPVSNYAAPLYDKNEIVGAVYFLQDLREIKRLERELVGAERLAAIGQTMAGVAHGVKNILHGFKGGSYLVDLGIHKRDDGKLKKGWDMIQRNISRTSDLVMDLLTYSKEHEPEFKTCNPNEIIQDVCEVMLDRANKHDVTLTMELDADIQSVIMDPHTIHQCLTNLISNGIDACLFDQHTNKRWQVTIQTEIESNQHIRISIIDNGMGMSEVVQKKLFTSFFSTKGHRGTGLGLLVTRKAVEEHGGIIEVESQKGQGTTFTLRLPFQYSTTSKKEN